jgi:creatinine amidohydrolase/Fe(II)-dependent formamide hydrolase-like protein
VYAKTVGYRRAEPGWLDRVHTDGLDAVSDNGVLGDPSRAKAEAGPTIFDAITARLVDWIAVEFSLTASSAVSADESP